VDDAEDVREMVSTLLGAEGAEVVVAPNGRAALAAALGGDFDVVVTDYGLPDIPGAFLIRQVLAVSHRRPRVVVITGYGEPYTGWARQAGADLVLSKPIDWPRFLQHLRAAVQQVAA